MIPDDRPVIEEALALAKDLYRPGRGEALLRSMLVARFDLNRSQLDAVMQQLYDEREIRPEASGP